ncbi:hypothetical protein OSB04_024661 [Centaurea solstitialis]|uniref:Tf2-1-like SH3-like domain-containing protein n=1 Tax=Centaurea solstitialis TaxID=347529 RepID=A0AA38WCA5_9ASTR|nr:hypothetical protein OSB04_024661 [Centaurea solstitialis]
MVMLKVSPWKGILRFGKQGKLSRRFVGPFKIIERIGKQAYRLELPEELSGIHDVFHVGYLRKCLGKYDETVPLTEVKIGERLRYIEKPEEILNETAAGVPPAAAAVGRSPSPASLLFPGDPDPASIASPQHCCNRLCFRQRCNRRVTLTPPSRHHRVTAIASPPCNRRRVTTLTPPSISVVSRRCVTAVPSSSPQRSGALPFIFSPDSASATYRRLFSPDSTSAATCSRRILRLLCPTGVCSRRILRLLCPTDVGFSPEFCICRLSIVLFHELTSSLGCVW